MGTRSKRSERCEVCLMHTAHCLCSELPSLDLLTRVVVIMHHREWLKPTSTARLYTLSAPNSEIRIRGDKDIPFHTDGIVTEDRRCLYLFPSGDARVLSTEMVDEDPRPISLIVPDGSWRQASKIGQREPAFIHLPRVVLPDMGPSRYRLRSEPKVGGLSTFEAIARALRILEGEETYQALDSLFTKMVERTLATRGTIR